MLGFIKNFFAVLCLALAEAWFLKGYFAGNYDYESLIAFFAAASVLICKDGLEKYFSATDHQMQSDRKLYKLFEETLPINETEMFLKNCDFNNSFPRIAIEGLNEFVALWGSADKEFFNSKLEKQKKVLYHLASKLASEIANRTVPVGSGENLSVFSDQLRAGGNIRPEFVLNDAKTINKCAGEFSKKYLAFVKACRCKLTSN